MNDKTMIDSCQADLPVQYASNIELIRQKWLELWSTVSHSRELHVQNKPLICSIGCPCSRFSILHSDKNVYTMSY